MIDPTWLPLYHTRGQPCGGIACYAVRRLIPQVSELNSRTIRLVDGSAPIAGVTEMRCGACGRLFWGGDVTHERREIGGEMPPEPARPHAGPWRIEHPEHLTAPLLRAADGAELYYLEPVSATVADDALVAAAPSLRAALEALLFNYTKTNEHGRTTIYDIPAEQLENARAALNAATAPAAPGEPHA